MPKMLLGMVVLLTFMITACNEEETGPTTLVIESDITINGAPIDTSEVYPLGENSIKFAVANAYVGGFSITTGEDKVDLDDYLLLKSSDQQIPVPGEFNPADGLTEVSFFVGVEPSINGQSEADFLSRSIEDPLSLKDPAMHWNWNTGYRFVRVDAEAYIPIKDFRLADSILIQDTMLIDTVLVIDTSFTYVFDTVTIATDTAIIEYHIGTDSLLTPIVLSEGFGNLQAGENTLLVRFDVGALFRDIDLKDSTNRVTHTFDNLPLALEVRENIRDHAIGYRLN